MLVREKGEQGASDIRIATRGAEFSSKRGPGDGQRLTELLLRGPNDTPREPKATNLVSRAPFA